MAQWNRDTQSFLQKDTTHPGREDFTGVTIADRFGSITDWRPDFTSKNRLKMSAPATVFWNSFSAFADNDTFVTTTSGDGKAYINNDATVPEDFDPINPGTDQIVEKSVILRVSTAGDKVIRQSRRVIPYIPGKEQFVSLACRFAPPTEFIRRRIGMFDEENGMFFEDDGENYYVVLRKNGVETVRVARENWNGDKLNGVGRSGILFDSTKQQLLGIEYEWYGTGMVRFGYVINNELHAIHTIYNANNTVGTWTKTPNLPLRFEHEALPGWVGGPQYLYQSSSSVIAEGGIEDLGVLNNSISGLNTTTTPPTMSVAGTNLSVADTFFPLLSIRLKDATLDSFVSPQAFQIFAKDNADCYFVIVRNPTLTGAVFNIADNDWIGAEIDDQATAVDFDITDVIYSGFFPGSSSTPISLPVSAQLQLGRTFANPGAPDFANLTSDVITICAACRNATTQAFASLTWLEQP